VNRVLAAEAERPGLLRLTAQDVELLEVREDTVVGRLEFGPA